MMIRLKIKNFKRDINREAAKKSVLSSGRIDNYEYLTGGEILPSNQKQIIEQAAFPYSPLEKDFEKQTKTIEVQGEKQEKALEKHEKQQFKSRSEKESLIHVKQTEIFEEFFNKGIDEIQNLSKQIDFNKLTYHFKGKNATKNLQVYRNLNDSYITLEKAEQKQKELK